MNINHLENDIINIRIERRETIEEKIEAQLSEEFAYTDIVYKGIDKQGGYYFKAEHEEMGDQELILYIDEDQTIFEAVADNGQPEIERDWEDWTYIGQMES